MSFNLFATINYYNLNLTVESLQASSSPTANYNNYKITSSYCNVGQWKYP